MGRRWARSQWLWGWLALVAIVVGGVVWGVMNLPALIEWQAQRMLRAAGFPAATVRVERIAPWVMTLHVVLDQAADQRVGWIALDYSLRSIERLRFDKLEISGTRLHIAADGSVPGYRPR